MTRIASARVDLPMDDLEIKSSQTCSRHEMALINNLDFDSRRPILDRRLLKDSMNGQKDAIFFDRIDQDTHLWPKFLLALSSSERLAMTSMEEMNTKRQSQPMIIVSK